MASLADTATMADGWMMPIGCNCKPVAIYCITSGEALVFGWWIQRTHPAINNGTGLDFALADYKTGVVIFAQIHKRSYRVSIESYSNRIASNIVTKLHYSSIIYIRSWTKFL